MNKPNAPGEGSELPALVSQKDAAEAMCSLCRGTNGFVRKVVALPDMLRPNTYWHAHSPEYNPGHAKCDASPIWALAALSSPEQESAEFRWIPCEQELPSIGQTVIVQGGIAYRVEDEWISQTGGASGRPIMWPVTHWAKIPDIPAPPVTAEGKDRG